MNDVLTVLRSVTKPPLRTGLSYVLKTTQLDTALATAKLAPHVDLSYWEPSGGGSILQAFYWLANESIDQNRVYVRAGCVPSQQRRDAAAALTNEGLPSFIAWVRTLVALPANAPMLHQRPFFDATYGSDGLCVCHTPSKLVETIRQESL